MNLEVDQPTKMIRLDLSTDRTQRKRGNAPSGAAAPEGLNIPGGEPAPNAFEGRWAEAAMLVKVVNDTPASYLYSIYL